MTIPIVAELRITASTTDLNRFNAPTPNLLYTNPPNPLYKEEEEGIDSCEGVKSF
jgi:hypothetical protein